MSDNPQPNYQPGWTPQQYAPAPSPKKSHTTRNATILVLGLFMLAILFFGGCAVLLGSAVDDVDKTMKEEAANDKPSKVVEGKAFTHDIWEVKRGWDIRDGGIEKYDTNPITGTITNVGNSADMPLLTFSLDKGNRVLGTVDCTGNKLQPGQSARLDCVINETGPVRANWDTVTVRDVF